MAFKRLTDRLRLGTAVAAGLIGLAGIPNDANAQTVLNESIEVKDSNGNVVNTMQAGQTYLINVNAENIYTSNLDFSSLGQVLKLTFGNGAAASDVTFGYTPSPNPAGTPTTNDIFQDAVANNAMNESTNFGNYTPINSNSGTFSFTRTADGYFPTLTIAGEDKVKNIASFYFTPNSSLLDGSVTFSYDSAFAIDSSSNNFNDLFTAGGSPIMFLNGSNSLTLNFTAVPEPSTYALLAGGLALAGAAAMRKRRQQDKGSGGSTRSAPETREI